MNLASGGHKAPTTPSPWSIFQMMSGQCPRDQLGNEWRFSLRDDARVPDGGDEADHPKAPVAQPMPDPASRREPAAGLPWLYDAAKCLWTTRVLCWLQHHRRRHAQGLAGLTDHGPRRLTQPQRSIGQQRRAPAIAAFARNHDLVDAFEPLTRLDLLDLCVDPRQELVPRAEGCHVHRPEEVADLASRGSLPAQSRSQSTRPPARRSSSTGRSPCARRSASRAEASCRSGGAMLVFVVMPVARPCRRQQVL